jgi:hypothetical protein
MRIILALLALVVAGCCDGLTVPPAPGPDAGRADTVPEGPCCMQWEPGPGAFSVPGCWQCGPQIRCVGTPCSTGATTLPACAVQPSEPWTSGHPHCE